MSLNLFGKIYLAPDYLYDNFYTRAIFSADRNQAEYLNYDTMDHPGYGSGTIISESSIYNIIGEGEGKYLSIAEYLVHLYTNTTQLRIYADADSWLPVFFTWIRIATPNITDDVAFIVYNTVKQRQKLVFPDNRDKSFMIPRLSYRNSDVVYTKAEFVQKLAEFKSNDVTTDARYNEIRDIVRNDLPIEIQLASYLAGNVDVSNLTTKMKSIGSKIIFSIVEDVKVQVRENIMTETIKSLSGVNLSWEDQYWETTLRSKSPELDFLFECSIDSLGFDETYREQHIQNAIDVCNWFVANAPLMEGNVDIYNGAEWVINNAGIFSSDQTVVAAAIEAAISADVNYSGTTLFFQGEYMIDRINAFLIEYVYQLAAQNNVEGLNKLSHT